MHNNPPVGSQCITRLSHPLSWRLRGNLSVVKRWQMPTCHFSKGFAGHKSNTKMVLLKVFVPRSTAEPESRSVSQHRQLSIRFPESRPHAIQYHHSAGSFSGGSTQKLCYMKYVCIKPVRSITEGQANFGQVTPSPNNRKPNSSRETRLTGIRRSCICGVRKKQTS